MTMKSIFPALLLFVCAVSCANSPKIPMTGVGDEPAFRATVENVNRYAIHDHLALTIRLLKSDGTILTIEEPQATLTEAAFANFLQPGKSYVWPQVFTEFEHGLKRPKGDGLQMKLR